MELKTMSTLPSILKECKRVKLRRLSRIQSDSRSSLTLKLEFLTS